VERAPTSTLDTWPGASRQNIRTCSGRLAVINVSSRFRRGDDWLYGSTDDGIAHFTDAARDGGIRGITDAVLQPDVVFADVGLAAPPSSTAGSTR
jgi:hypothetical protein